MIDFDSVSNKQSDSFFMGGANPHGYYPFVRYRSYRLKLHAFRSNPPEQPLLGITSGYFFGLWCFAVQFW